MKKKYKLKQKDYHHYCKGCKVFFACTHHDPEMMQAKCPQCKGTLTLGHGCTLEGLKAKIGLSASEIGEGDVTYIWEP